MPAAWRLRWAVAVVPVEFPGIGALTTEVITRTHAAVAAAGAGSPPLFLVLFDLRRRSQCGVASEGLFLVASLHQVVVPICGVAVGADARPPCLVVASGTPGPAGAAADGEVVPVESEDGGDNSDEVAEENVEGVVAEVEPAGAGDEDGEEGGEHHDGEEVNGRSSGLAADGRQGLLVLVELLSFAAIRAGLGNPRGEGGEGGVVDLGRARDEGDGDGELAGEEQREVDEASRGSAGVTRGVASEALVELIRVRLLANVGRNEHSNGENLVELGGNILLGDAANDKLAEVGEVWLAAGEHIGTRAAKHVLHAVCDEPGAHKGQSQTDQAGVKLPQLALPQQRGWRALGDGVSRNEY